MKTVKTFARQFSFSLMMAMTLGSAVVPCGEEYRGDSYSNR